jgi:hypothetical protein
MIASSIDCQGMETLALNELEAERSEGNRYMSHGLVSFSLPLLIV